MRRNFNHNIEAGFAKYIYSKHIIDWEMNEEYCPQNAEVTPFFCPFFFSLNSIWILYH